MKLLQSSVARSRKTVCSRSPKNETIPSSWKTGCGNLLSVGASIPSTRVTGTDTAFGVRGEAEAAIAALVVLGVSQEEAYETLRAYWAEVKPDNPLEAGNVPLGVHDWAFRACREHAGPFSVRLIPNIPFVEPD